MDIPEARPGPGAKMVVVYTAWFITTPQYSRRFGPLLQSLQAEKIIAAATLLAIILQGGLPRVKYGLVGLVLGLYLIMVVSFMASPYSGSSLSQGWAEQYWKTIVYFLFIVCGLRTLGELAFLLRWIVFTVLFYEVLSWRDFLGGGSFVYQQGIIRMIGCWSGATIGAANEWASLTLTALPFSAWLLGSATTRGRRRVAVAAIALSGLSVLYSGTRGALMVGLMYGVFKLRRQVFRLRTAALLAVLAAVGASLAPQSLIERYSSSFDFLSGEEPQKKAGDRHEQIARESAEGRVQGLIDGFNMGVARPVFGYGPGSSPKARREVNPDAPDLQLHNVYGQVVGELGFVGAAAWLALILASIRGTSPARYGLPPGSEAPEPYRQALSLRRPLVEGILLLLMYGMFGHNLYDFRWLTMFGCLAVLQSALESEQHRQVAL